VFGVARKANSEELQHHGVHLALMDLGELAERPADDA
jgi:hypothetical protein